MSIQFTPTVGILASMIGGGRSFAKWTKIRGPKVLLLKLGGQNRKFVKIKRAKMQFNQTKISKEWKMSSDVDK
jgi:hypothetical protein